MTTNVFARIVRRLDAAADELDRMAKEAPAMHGDGRLERLWAAHLREDATYMKTLSLRQA